ncbi:1-acyl-sn-glycerol-3-phosphate acyltransferase [Svornostia abyssi]|uniref:1-acyl-sn-glycerol-3-phosphate acyltransferase n=1 Tax=Svornostia abyssi TaxID=2898438 RepID=A0ABY5PF72_9ACTN|nr:1-acyl-sn-glycerol-3-phosphate acyltransferase [Parviterribacteraceae bacterium J379]
MDRSKLHARVRDRGVNPLVYWPIRAVFWPFFIVYFRLRWKGSKHIPKQGPVIIAANHRSFLDPFVIGAISRRPMYFVAKRELFEGHPLQRWFLNSLGAFPVDRGNGDGDAMGSAKTILERGEPVVIFPEGTRVRPGGLGRPRRGVGRLALETGAPVVPVAVIGTENIRTGMKIRPHKVRIHCGAAMSFPKTENPTATMAAAVVDRVWPCVQLQWEYLGGEPPVRRAAIIGAGSWGTALAVALARGGVRVQLGARTAEQAETLSALRENERYLPGVTLPEFVDVTTASQLDLEQADLVCLAVPSRAIPATVAAHADRIQAGAGVLVLSKGLVPPLGTLPSAYVAERVRARAVATLGGPALASDVLANGAAVVLACSDPACGAVLRDTLRAARLQVTISTDVTGVELAGVAKNAAVLAAAASVGAGPNAAGAAAGKVFAEVDRYARACGAQPESFSGLAGAGDLVATVVAESSRNRRAGELLASGVPAAAIEPRLGQTPESLDTVALLAETLERSGVHAPTIAALADLVGGRIAPDQWAAGVTSPDRPTVAA